MKARIIRIPPRRGSYIKRKRIQFIVNDGYEAALIQQVTQDLAELRNGATWPISANDLAIRFLVNLGIIRQPKRSVLKPSQGLG